MLSFLPYFSNGKGDYGNWGGGEKHGDAISIPYVILTEQAEALERGNSLSGQNCWTMFTYGATSKSSTWVAVAAPS